MRDTNIAQEDKTELQIIREALGYSRPQFARVVIKKSLPMLKLYEHKEKPIPEGVMALARLWKNFLDTINGPKTEE